MNVPSDKRIMKMKDIFTRYSNDVIATCTVVINVDSMRNPENDFYIFVKRVINFSKIAFIQILMYQHVLLLIHLLNLKLIDNCTNALLVNLVADTIRTREEKGITRPDMI